MVNVIIMDKKKFAIIIVAVSLVLVVGAYVAYYAYASMVIIPEDVNTLNDDLQSIEENTIPDSDIKELEELANQLESPDYVLVSYSQRKQLADELRNNPDLVFLKMSLITTNSTFAENKEAASKYDFLLKWDIARDMRSVYSDEYIITANKFVNTYENLPNDLEKGDEAKVVADLRELADNSRELNKLSKELKSKIQNLINKLEG